MNIQFNLGQHIPSKELLIVPLKALITEKLKHYDREINKIEVHLTDEDATKDGPNNKRCMLEAHLDGMSPIIATHHDNSHEQALEGALEKLIGSLENKIGRLRDR